MFLSVVAFSARFAVFFDAFSVIWHARVCCAGALLWLGFVGKLRICGGCGGGDVWWGGAGWGGLITFLFIYVLTYNYVLDPL